MQLVALRQLLIWACLWGDDGAHVGSNVSPLPGQIRATYKQLGLQTYFTVGEKETRAWTIKSGFTAPQVRCCRIVPGAWGSLDVAWQR